MSIPVTLCWIPRPSLLNTPCVWKGSCLAESYLGVFKVIVQSLHTPPRLPTESNGNSEGRGVQEKEFSRVWGVTSRGLFSGGSELDWKVYFLALDE